MIEISGIVVRNYVYTPKSSVITATDAVSCWTLSHRQRTNWKKVILGVLCVYLVWDTAIFICSNFNRIE